MLVVFDLDGTLIDSEPDIRAALNRLLVSHGMPALNAAAVTAMIGDGARALVQKAFAAFGRAAFEPEVAAFLAAYNENAVVKTAVYPGVMQALATLRDAGHNMAVCTNKPEASARAILASLHLDGFFATVIGGDTTAYRKPDPRPLAAAVQALGGGPAVMVGDHENDMAAARNLGIKSIFAAWGYGKAQGTHAASTAGDLPDLIARMQAAG